MEHNIVVGHSTKDLNYQRLKRQVKYFALLSILIVGTAIQVNAQMVQRVFGSQCVGQNNLFQLSGTTGCFVTWTVTGTNYTINSQTSTSINLKWNVPTPGARVTANFSGCSAAPWSGSAFSPAYNIESPLTPTISIVANQNNVCTGSSIRFDATITNGGTSPTYYWKVNGTTAPGATNSSIYTTTSLTNGQVVTCQLVSNVPCPASSPTSSGITMSILAPSPVSVVINSTAMPFCGGVGSFTATPTNGGANPTYTWYKNGVLATDNLPGTSVFAYAPANPLPDQTRVSCVMTSNLGCVSGNPATSNEITVSVTTPIVPDASMSPGVNAICEGENITFTATSPEGGYTMGSFSWTLNGIAVGSNSSTYSTTTLPASNSVAVTVSFGGSCIAQPNSKTITATQVTVKPKPNPSVVPSGSVKICSTCDQQVTAWASGSGYSYVWKNLSGVIAEATSMNYVTNVPNTYSADVTLNGCTGSTGTLALTKNIAATVNAGADKSVPLPINSTSLSGSASDADGSISTYAWFKELGPAATLSGQATATLTLTNLVVGTYQFRLDATDNFGEISSDRAYVTVYFPNNYNRIQEVTVRIPQITEAAVAGLAIGPKQETWQYCDGLARPMQTVAAKVSPGNLDLVQPIIYGPQGRETKKYLPFTNGTNSYHQLNSSILNASGDYIGAPQAFYATNSNNQVADDIRPYSETVFELSPLDRPDRQYGPGLLWSTATGGNNKFVKKSYLRNQHGAGSSTTQEKVIAWKISAGMPTRAAALLSHVETGGYYSSNQLYINVTTDEQQNSVREYTNKDGQIVLKKVQAVALSSNLNGLDDWVLTYYVYDDNGNLRYVFQPELSKLLHQGADSYIVTATDLANWAFQYKYDDRKRMTEKKVPGADWVYMIYDKRDRLVLTQDGNQRNSTPKYWSFTKYDELNRPIATGIKDTTAALTQGSMQLVVNGFYTKGWTRLFEQYVGNATGNIYGYTNKSYPLFTAGASIEPASYLSITYYDKYDFKALWIGDYDYKNETPAITQLEHGVTYTMPSAAFTRVVGRQLGTMVKVLDGGVLGGYTWLKSVNYFDDKYRLIQVQSENYKGGTERVTNLYNFAGQILKSKTTHTQNDIVWKDKVGVQSQGNRLYKTLPNAWGDGGAASEQQLPAGQNGWVEATASETSLYRMVGLSDVNTNANYNTIDYAWYFAISGALYVHENTVNRGQFGTYKTGDILKIERTGTVINYYLNNVLKYTSTVASSSLLMVDVAFHNQGSTLTNVRTSFGATSSIINRRMEYDNGNRLVRFWHQVDSNPEILLTHNKYNELGQLIDKKLHSTNAGATDARQSVDYRYNIRGWLTSINNSQLSNDGPINDDTGDYFGMNLGYNTNLGMTDTLSYNGNISAITWSNYLGQATVKEKSFTYGYDPLNRLTSANFKEKAASWAAAANKAFTEPRYRYDLNGNIKRLTRYDKKGSTAIMDNMVYDYGAGVSQSNRLLNVVDNGDDFSGFVDGTNGVDYTYDLNGNLTTDQNKGITSVITYNVLNLPEVLTRGGNTIRYIYDATGRKLSQVTNFAAVQKQTDYVNEFTYENDALQFISHEEGRTAFADEKDIYVNDGSSLDGAPAYGGASAAIVAQNGNQTYIRLTSSGAQYGGIHPLKGGFPAAPGDRFRFRVKGYTTTAQPVYLLASTNLGNILWNGQWYGSPLPTSTSTESWIEETVTIPPGATIVNLSVIWNTSTSGGQFFINDIVVTKLSSSTAPEYQYNLKDHLGNVRLTFTTKDETLQHTASFEDNAQATESKTFKNYTRVTNDLFDHTDAGTVYNKAQLLNGGNNSQVGLTKSFAVMPGDVILAQVWAKHYGATGSGGNLTGFATALLSAFGLAAPVAGEVGTASVGLQNYGNFISGGGNPANAAWPKGFLNILVFNKDFTLVDIAYQQLEDSYVQAVGSSSKMPHQQLTRNVTIKEPGYVFVYLSNEGSVQKDIYFDDVNITHTKSKIIQTSDYYSFGLPFNSYQRESSVSNRHKYNGKEDQDELGLDWLDYGARMYMADIGRWGVIDPMAEGYRRWSPYSYTLDNPLRFIDPDGKNVEEVTGGKRYTGVDAQRQLTHLKMMNAVSAKNSSAVNESEVVSSGPGPGKGPKPTDKTNRIDTGKPNPHSPLKAPVLAILFEIGRLATGAYYAFSDWSEKNPVDFGPQAIEQAVVKTGTTILGKFPEYIHVADEMAYNVLDIAPDVWKAMSDPERLAQHHKFLDEAIARGDDFVFSTVVKNVEDVTGWFRRELDYLIGQKGYKLSDDGQKLVK